MSYVSDMNHDDRQAEPSVTQMLQALLTDHEEERFWERVQRMGPVDYFVDTYVRHLNFNC